MIRMATALSGFLLLTTNERVPLVGEEGRIGQAVLRQDVSPLAASLETVQRRIERIGQVGVLLVHDSAGRVSEQALRYEPIARPDRQGNFDYITFDDPAFVSAHLYGTARFVLDVWEKYFGHHLIWYHSELYPRLELVPLVDWDNAQSGPGFLETGTRRNRAGELRQ